MKQQQFTPYQVGDRVELYRNTSNFAVNGGYAEFKPVRGTITTVGPDNRYFILSTAYQNYMLDAAGQYDNVCGLHYSRKSR